MTENKIIANTEANTIDISVETAKIEYKITEIA